MKKGIFAIVFIFISTIVFAQSKEAQVLERVNALNKAIFQTKDSAAIQDLVSSKATYGHSTGIIEDKPTMLHNAIVSTLVYNNLTIEPLKIFFADENTAIVRHIVRANPGTESPLNISILQVWEKEGKKWRLVARQAAKVPPKS